jgi:hypothetical protein
MNRAVSQRAFGAVFAGLVCTCLGSTSALAGIDPEASGFRGAIGPLLRSDRGTPAGLKGGLAIAAEAPVVWRFAVRMDFVTGMESQDQLRASGPTLGILPTFRQPLGKGEGPRWALDVAAGPTLWFGKSTWWEGVYPGPFPGFRGAGGVEYRPHSIVAIRAEGGTDHNYGTLPLLNGSAHGWDARLMVVARQPTNP